MKEESDSMTWHQERITLADHVKNKIQERANNRNTGVRTITQEETVVVGLG